MIRNKKYRKTVLLLKVADVIIESNLGDKLCSKLLVKYNQTLSGLGDVGITNNVNKGGGVVMSKVKDSNVTSKASKVSKIIDFGISLGSAIVTNKQKKEHEKVVKENQKAFMEAWEKHYGSFNNDLDDEGNPVRKPLDLTGGKDE